MRLTTRELSLGYEYGSYQDFAARMGLDQNASPLHMRGIADASWRLDCFARWMLANWSRARILEWLQKNPTQADAMRARLNEQRGKRNGM